ncbi:MAG TPA: hypothetical protein VFT60_13240, partial [Bryobacteraceae bacterium]|nr:hypothetical protein [Bryobacteraceae bacterium]
MSRKLIALALFICGVAAAAPAEHWVATWGTAQQRAVTGRPGASGASGRPTVGIIPTRQPPAPAPGKPGRRFPIPPTLAGIDNQTVRMIVRTSMGGSRVRVRLSNAVGGAPVSLGS